MSSRPWFPSISIVTQKLLLPFIFWNNKHICLVHKICITAKVVYQALGGGARNWNVKHRFNLFPQILMKIQWANGPLDMLLFETTIFLMTRSPALEANTKCKVNSYSFKGTCSWIMTKSTTLDAHSIWCFKWGFMHILSSNQYTFPSIEHWHSGRWWWGGWGAKYKLSLGRSWWYNTSSSSSNGFC